MNLIGHRTRLALALVALALAGTASAAAIEGLYEGTVAGDLPDLVATVLTTLRDSEARTGDRSRDRRGLRG